MVPPNTIFAESTIKIMFCQEDAAQQTRQRISAKTVTVIA
jgi:hypothetical protein